MKYGVFYNSPKSQCSIYESGLMIYNALKQSSAYDIAYTENQALVMRSDFAIFNYHPYVNSWMNHGLLRNYSGQTFGVVLEVGHHGDLMPNTAKMFQKYMIIDPTIQDTDTVFGFPRPIERYPYTSTCPHRITVGSFGFATPGKRWIEVLELTNAKFDDALIRINIPYATFVPNCQSEIDKISTELLNFKLKPNVDLELTHNYMEKQELIKWCSQNSVNFFPYYRDLAGLAAVTDQAISAQKPILVTNNSAFRHIHKYLKPYPEIGLKQAIVNNLTGVLKMYDDWSPQNFYKKFESIL